MTSIQPSNHNSKLPSELADLSTISEMEIEGFKARHMEHPSSKSRAIPEFTSHSEKKILPLANQLFPKFVDHISNSGIHLSRNRITPQSFMDHSAHAPANPGLVGLTKPILLHSLRNPACNLKQQTQAECDWKFSWWRNWYLADWAYALPVVYLYCAAIAFFALVHIISRVRHSKRHPKIALSLPGYRKLSSLFRYLTARQIRVGQWYSPSVGVMVLVAGLIVFFSAMTLGPKPFNWPSVAYGGSPPIATRTGWMAIAMLPFLMTFATKWNIITLLTGVSHEKIQVYHHWTAWIMYVLALIHTFPFIMINIKNGQMEAAWKYKVWYWTGVAALIPQTWLVFMSWGPIRNRYYETFKSLHRLAAAFFIPMLFIHCNFRLTSWDYFIATAAIYSFSLLVRFGRTFFKNGISTAEFENLPANMVKVTIPTHVQWKAGQHFLFRFFNAGGLHAWTSHPFTVASIPTSENNHIKLYIRVKAGTTSRLTSFSSSERTNESKVMMDGPYGGIPVSLEAYDRVLLMAGGGGGSFIIPILLDLASKSRAGMVCRHVDVWWATKTADSVTWFRSAFRDALKISDSLDISINIHITDQVVGSNSEILQTSDEKALERRKSETSGSEDAGDSGVRVLQGRPNLREIILGVASQHRGTLGIAACGPDSFGYDIRNTVADLQLDISSGKSSVQEIYLHNETFGW